MLAYFDKWFIDIVGLGTGRRLINLQTPVLDCWYYCGKLGRECVTINKVYSEKADKVEVGRPFSIGKLTINL